MRLISGEVKRKPKKNLSALITYTNISGIIGTFVRTNPKYGKQDYKNLANIGPHDTFVVVSKNKSQIGLSIR